MHALITGGSGYLGSRLLLALRDDVERIVVADVEAPRAAAPVA